MAERGLRRRRVVVRARSRSELSPGLPIVAQAGSAVCVYRHDH